MAFRWKDYLDLAEALKGRGEALDQEACFRSATSRACYAAYCHARNWAHKTQNFVILDKPKDHQRLRDHFMENNMGDIADKLDDMRKWRNRCDYKDYVSKPQELARDSIRWAHHLLKLLA